MPAATIFVAIAWVAAGQVTDDRQTELAEIRARITRIQNQVVRNRQLAQSISTDVDGLNLQIDLAFQEVAAAAKSYEITNARMLETNEEIGLLSERIGKGEQYLKRRVVVLYKLGRMSYLRYLFGAGESRDLLSAIKYTSYLAGRDSRAIEDYRRSSQALETKSAELTAQRNAARRGLANLENRKATYVKSRGAKEAYLERLNADSRRGQLQVASLEERAERLEALLKALFESAKGTAPGEPILRFKGVLAWPVKGELVGSFGRQKHPVFNTYTRRNGVEITVDPGTEVRAIYTGEVVFARFFKGYGNMVVIDHRDKVFSLYAHLAEIGVQHGATVRIAEPIARTGGEGVAEGGPFYFELRVGNEPVNPADWLTPAPIR